MKSRRSAFLRKALIVMTLASAATASAQYIAAGPMMNVRVHWSTPEELQQKCGTKAGCVSGVTADKPYVEIWAEKPQGWEDDERICTLGDQLLALSENPNSNIAMGPTLQRINGPMGASRAF